MSEQQEMVREMTAKEFSDSGALWFINQTLHLFGMAITWDPDTGVLTASWVKFRGFGEKNNTAGYRKLTEYMKANVSKLLEDCD